MIAGQLGNGDKTDQFYPVPTKNLRLVTKMALGGCHNCAVVLGGQTYCWGSNYSGQLGIGDEGGRLLPEEVLLEP